MTYYLTTYYGHNVKYFNAMNAAGDFGRKKAKRMPVHRHALMMGYADREHGLLARSRALRTKPSFGGQHEAGC